RRDAKVAEGAGTLVARGRVAGRGESAECGVNHRIIRRAVILEWEVLIQVVEHQAPGGPAGDGKFSGPRGRLSLLVVFVADNRLAEPFQVGDPLRNLLHRNSVEMNEQKIAGLGHSRRQSPVADTAG